MNRGNTKVAGRAAWIPLSCAAIALLLSSAVQTRAQEKPYVPWVAPADAKAVKSPLKATPDVIKAGQETFRENCEVCHGPKGDGTGPTAKTLTIKPANFTDPKLMSQETDGSLFWKMSKGRGAMPSWEDQLSDTERWQLVAYIKTFSKGGAAKAEKKD
jgi:mono/diheme cytochrome c family protein